MSSPLALSLFGTAALLALAALSVGPLAAFVASPVCFGLAIAAVEVVRDPVEATARRAIAAGLAALLIGGAIGLASSAALGVAVLGASVAVVFLASGFSLAQSPPRRDENTPVGTEPAVVAGVVADELIKLVVEVRRLSRRRPDYRTIAADVRDAADRNEDRGWVDHPELSHLPPPPLEKAVVHRRQVRGAGVLEHLSFASEYEPADPEIRDDYLGVRANRTAHVWLDRHPGGPRPTLLCVHGYGLGSAALDARSGNVRWLAEELGFDLALVTLLLHGPRGRRRISGDGVLTGHPLWTNAAMGQAVWELRRVAGWLRAEGAPALGVMGLSIGGYVAALYASIESGLACAITAVAPSALDRFFWSRLPESRRAQARAAGLTSVALANAWACHAPLRVRPQMPRDARLIIGGLTDRIVAPDQIEALWEHWGHPPLHWFPGGHVLWRRRDEIRARLAAHLRDSFEAAA